MIEKVISVKVETDEAVQEVDNLNESLDESQQITSEMGASALESAKSFKIMGVSINGVSKALKVLRVSLIATGIGAIVVAVGSLAAAFLSTQDGANFLTRALEPLKEVMATIWGVAQDLGKALAKIVTGDVVGGWDDMAAAVDGFGEKMGEAWERGNQLADIEIKLMETEANHIRVLSDLNLQREKHRATVDDETRSLEDRKAAATNLNAVNEAIFKLEQDRTNEELKLLKLRTEANDTDYQAKVEIARKEAELNQAAAVREKQRKEEFLIARRLGQGATEGQEPGSVVSPVTGLSTDQIVELAEIQEVAILGSAQELADGVAKINKKASDEEIARQKNLVLINKLTATEKAQAALQIAGDLAFALGALSEEGSEAQKKFRIAGAIIDTLAGAVAGMLAGLSVGGPWGIALGIATSAAVLAAGYANVRKIQSTEPGGSISGGGETPQIGQPQFNVVGANNTNVLNETIAENNVTPVKTYVVASDVTTQQALDRSTLANAGT